MCLCLPLLLAVGCQSYEKRRFDVVIKNNASKPITIGLSKRGGPPEEVWASPEELAVDPRSGDTAWGTVVPPGKTAYPSNIVGHFTRNGVGYVRIYAGDLTLTEILAIGRGSRERIDWRLRPGKTTLVVSDRGEGIDVFESFPDINEQMADPQPAR